MNRLQSRSLMNKGFMAAAAFALVALVEQQFPNGAVAVANSDKPAQPQHALPYESRPVHGVEFLGRADTAGATLKRAEQDLEFADIRRQDRWVF